MQDDTEAGPGHRNILVVCLRNDLRLHDHEIWYQSHLREHSEITHILPLYVFDERQIELSGLPGYQRQGPEARTRLCNFWRTGVFRARFLAESVYDIKHRLRSVGSDLVLRFGILEDVVEHFVQAIQEAGDNVYGVWMSKEICDEEVLQEERIQKRMQARQVPVRYIPGKQLVHPDDLPFAIENTPDVFTPFRKKIESLGARMARLPVPTPSRFKPCPVDIQTSDYGAQVENDGVDTIIGYFHRPLAGQLQVTQSYDQHSSKSAFPFQGGETSALARLQWYFHDGGAPPPVSRYKQTRNHLLGHSYSTKMSPFLCVGSISPRLVLQRLAEHERHFGSSANTYWVQFELLWRDYFMYITCKFGKQLFKIGGFEEITDPKAASKKIDDWNDWDPNDEKLQRWMSGKTGVPFIDANMVELVQSGFMSNRGRQNVASFLTKDLYYDWRIGAEYFEAHLVDFEPCANYGNWQYVSGVGNDPRASRQFNPIKQGKDYDAHGQYIKHWLPQLNKLPTAKAHVPWLLTAEERQKFGLTDKSYPARPLVEQEGWKPHYVRKDGERSKMHGNASERIRDADARVNSGRMRLVQVKGPGFNATDESSNSSASASQTNSNYGSGSDSDGPSVATNNSGSGGSFSTGSGSGSGSATGSGSGSASTAASSIQPERNSGQSLGEKINTTIQGWRGGASEPRRSDSQSWWRSGP